jgi:4-hydroxy-tetrahydrodipicolinate reductase
VRRCAGHPRFELVAVMVHSDDKAGRDSGALVGAEPNGIVTTQSVGDILAARPDAAIHSGLVFDLDLITTLLRGGVNVYSGIGGFYLPGSPDFDLIDRAAKDGGASFGAGGNIPGLISDVFPLFLTGYTGRIRQIRARQRNDVSTYPSSVQIQSLGIGMDPDAERAHAASFAPVVDRIMRQPVNMVADGLGIECTGWAPSEKRIVLAEADITLPASGLVITAGQVAGIEWTWTATSGDTEFFTLTNQQTAALGLGPGWRETHDEPPWRVEIDGEPTIVATFGWPVDAPPGESTALLNVARAMNTIPRLVDAPPGAVSVLDFPAPTAADGLAAT